jgi:membrane protease YdiL (CAAX protease family)
VLHTAGALFAAAHLDPSSFFGLTVLGVAAGGVVQAAGGAVAPAIAAHAAYNSAALLAGMTN